MTRRNPAIVLPSPTDRLIVRQLSDGILVFDNATGATHLLSLDVWNLVARRSLGEDAANLALTEDESFVFEHLKHARLID